MTQSSNRLLSLDFLRGFIMVTLVLGETGIFSHASQAWPNGFTEFLNYEFRHSEWHGLRFWDVILPAFMLIAGTAMAFSFKHQQEQGLSYSHSLRKILKRSFWLLFWGILIYAVRDGHLNFQLSNVLTQLSFTTLIAFLVIRMPAGYQLTVSIFCLVLSEALNRLINIPGFDRQFVQNQNFGSYVNQLFGIALDDGHKTTFINFITSGAHTIWGVMAGQLFMSSRESKTKFGQLVLFGVLFILAGVGLDLFGITPIMKWISTSSFVLVTGGITLLVMALCYEWIDVRDHRTRLKFFTIVGMNSIFIYLFFIFIGDHWLNGWMATLCGGLLSFAGVPMEAGITISCLLVFAMEWYLCYFLYKKNLFFKI